MPIIKIAPCLLFAGSMSICCVSGRNLVLFSCQNFGSCPSRFICPKISNFRLNNIFLGIRLFLRTFTLWMNLVVKNHLKTWKQMSVLSRMISRGQLIPLRPLPLLKKEPGRKGLYRYRPSIGMIFGLDSNRKRAISYILPVAFSLLSKEREYLTNGIDVSCIICLKSLRSLFLSLLPPLG